MRKLMLIVMCASALGGAGCFGDDDDGLPLDATVRDAAPVVDGGARDGSADASASVDAGSAPMCSADPAGNLLLLNAASSSDSLTRDPTLPLLLPNGDLPTLP